MARASAATSPAGHQRLCGGVSAGIARGPEGAVGGHYRRAALGNDSISTLGRPSWSEHSTNRRASHPRIGVRLEAGDSDRARPVCARRSSPPASVQAGQQHQPIGGVDLLPGVEQEIMALLRRKAADMQHIGFARRPGAATCAALRMAAASGLAMVSMRGR